MTTNPDQEAVPPDDGNATIPSDESIEDTNRTRIDEPAATVKAEADAAIDTALAERWPGFIGVRFDEVGTTTLTFRTDGDVRDAFPGSEDPERHARFTRDLAVARSFRETWADIRAGANYLKGR